MPACKIHHLADLGLCNLVAEHTNDSDALLVHRQHQFKGLRVGHAKESLEHMHHKLHRSEVVVQDQDLVKRRSLGLGLGVKYQTSITVISAGCVFVGHDMLVLFQHSLFVLWLDLGRCQYKRTSPLEKGECAVFWMGRPVIDTIGFDADDTLWQNEQFFRLTQDRFADLLSAYTDPDHLHARLLEAERRNLGHYGFGIKGFVLSMIETAIEVTGGQVPGSVIGELIAAGQDMLGHPIELLPHAGEVVREMAAAHRVLLITKGDLLDQERKLAQSGLGDLFDGVEIVSDKTPAVYAEIFAADGRRPEHALMVGNSLKSDVIPAIEAGAFGVYVPHALTWALEHVTAPLTHARFRQIADLGELPDLLKEIQP